MNKETHTEENNRVIKVLRSFKNRISVSSATNSKSTITVILGVEKPRITEQELDSMMRKEFKESYIHCTLLSPTRGEPYKIQVFLETES